MKISYDKLLAVLKHLPVNERISTLRSLWTSGRGSKAKRGMSQSELGKAVGVTRWTVCAWEAEPTAKYAFAPSERARRRMSIMFGVPAKVFTPEFGNDGQPDPPPLPTFDDPEPLPPEEVAEPEPQSEPVQEYEPPPPGVIRIL